MNREAERSFRRVVWLATLGGVAFIMLPILLFWYRLPDNMVMRWDVHGDPAWAVPKLIHLSTYVGIYLFGAFIALRQRENATGPLMMLTCMGGVLGLVTCTVPTRNSTRPGGRMRQSFTRQHWLVSYCCQ